MSTCPGDSLSTSLSIVAERAGFEPAAPFRAPVFKTGPRPERVSVTRTIGTPRIGGNVPTPPPRTLSVSLSPPRRMTPEDRP